MTNNNINLLINNEENLLNKNTKEKNENVDIIYNINKNGDNSYLLYENINNINRYNYHRNNTYDRIFNNISYGNLKINGPIIGINNNKIKLKLHQKRMVYEMIQRENINYRLTSRINAFVLCDKVGSGKSIDVLSLISIKPEINRIIGNRLKYKPYDFTYCDFYGLNIKPTYKYKTNLIVIPHGIYNQWEEYLNKFFNLTYYGIKKRKDIEELNIQDVINGKYNVILLKSTRYNNFCDKMKIIYKGNVSHSLQMLEKYPKIKKLKRVFDKISYNFNRHNYVKGILNHFQKLKLIINNFDDDEIKNMLDHCNETKSKINIKGPIFERVFYDEASSIKLPNCRRIYGKVNWFITSSFNDLLEPYKYIRTTGFIKNIFSYNNAISHSNFIQEIYLKNNDDFIKKSFELPEPKYNYIKCFTPPDINILQDIALPEVVNALNAGDVNSAINLVGCKIHNENDIKKLILYKLNTKFKKYSNKKIINNLKFKINNIIINNLKKYKLITHEELFNQTSYSNNNNQSNNQLNNQLNNQINNQLNNQSNNQLNNQILNNEGLNNNKLKNNNNELNNNNNINNEINIFNITNNNIENGDEYLRLMSIDDVIKNNFETEFNKDLYNEYEMDIISCSNNYYKNILELNNIQNINLLSNSNILLNNEINLDELNLENNDLMSYELIKKIILFTEKNVNNIYLRYKSKELLKKLQTKNYSINTSIKSYNENINIIKEKINSLENRISNINDKNCPICISKVNKPCLSNCCKQTFCFQCLTMSINFDAKKRCPICRTPINLSQITVFDNKAHNITNNENEQLKTKNEMLIKIIKDNPNGRFLIFSEYDNTFNNIIDLLTTSNIKYNRLLGSSGRIKNIINDFKNNKINILLLNAKYYGSGLNLQMTSDIIIYHRMNKELEEQLIGRGQRLGRTSRLNIHYLCYENELNNNIKN